MDPFSKEVTDHLVALYFDTYFSAFEFFSPVLFLQEYTKGTVNSDLLYAVCAICARHSNHPAVVKTPPSVNGQVYVDRVKSRMAHLISQVNLETIHTLALTAEAEYCAGNIMQGYRLDGIAGRMALELGLHRLQQPIEFESESARISFETKRRTYSVLFTADSSASIMAGWPGSFHDPLIPLPTPSDDPSWWIERLSVTGRPMESIDANTLSILHNILKPRRIKDKSAATPTETETCSSGPSSTFASFGTVTASATCASSRLDMLDAYKELEADLEHWRTTVPEDWEPSRGKYSVSRTDKNIVATAIFYYLYLIFLHRPFLINPCLSIINRKGSHGGSRVASSDDTEDIEAAKEAEDKDESNEQQENNDQFFQQCLHKCIFAANEITAMAEQFTDLEIRVRGPRYAFAVFVAGTVYVIHRFFNMESNRGERKDDGLAVCLRFLQILGPYWKGAVDMGRLLERLCSVDNAASERDPNSPSMRALADIMISGSSRDANEIGAGTEASTTTLTYLDANLTRDIVKGGRHSESSTTQPTPWQSPSDLLAPTPGKQPLVTEKVDRDDAAEPLNAFLTTDSGVRTMWLHPEEMAALEESTILSLEKLSMLDKLK
ncbi:hypothetical protein BGZ95_000219 [Linnemannia exigua]|uniref:Xylanolytic transcriptional activator regulatory domain-containing protein n=1 Tax=Linnemannia exigua TaxID=604196 RepID=A0AAD4D909_9FUNG|nr:hypothetical protein BGZ95_000219 [Linnemannia exigua]